MKLFLNRKEVMAEMGIGRSAFYTLVRSGTLTATRLRDMRTGEPRGRRLYARMDVELADARLTRRIQAQQPTSNIQQPTTNSGRSKQ